MANKGKSSKKVTQQASTKKATKTVASKKVAKTTSKKATTSKATKASKSTKAAKTVKTATASKKVAKKATKKNTKKATKKVARKAAPKQTGGTNTRYFKVVIEGEDPHGRFSGTKPKQAANKALTSLLKTKEKDGKKTDGKIKFSIVECTRGSRHKTYNYVGERVELDNPMEVIIGSGANEKRIKYKFNNKVMKDKSA